MALNRQDSNQTIAAAPVTKGSRDTVAVTKGLGPRRGDAAPQTFAPRSPELQTAEKGPRATNGPEWRNAGFRRVATPLRRVEEVQPLIPQLLAKQDVNNLGEKSTSDNSWGTTTMERGATKLPRSLRAAGNLPWRGQFPIGRVLLFLTAVLQPAFLRAA